MAIGWSGDDDQVQKPGIQHFTRVTERCCLWCQLQCRVNALRISVADRRKFETGRVLDSVVVLVPNGTIGKETDAKGTFFHR